MVITLLHAEAFQTAKQTQSRFYIVRSIGIFLSAESIGYHVLEHVQSKSRIRANKYRVTDCFRRN